MCRGERVHSSAGEDGNGGRTGVYKSEKSKVEMPCFFYEKKIFIREYL